MSAPALDLAGQLAALIEQARAEGREQGRAEAAKSVAPRLVSVEQATEILGCSRAYLYGLLRDNTLAGVHLGRRRLIRADSIAALIERGGVPA